MSSINDIGNSIDIKSIQSPGGTKHQAAKNIEQLTKNDGWVKHKIPLLWVTIASTDANKQRAGILATSKGAGMTDADKKNFIEDWDCV